MCVCVFVCVCVCACVCVYIYIYVILSELNIQACYYINESNLIKNRCFFLLENVNVGDTINNLQVKNKI